MNDALSIEENENRIAKELLRKLYSDLEEYESIRGIKKLFGFLFSRVREIRAVYGSAQQIRDMIEEENGKCSSREARMNQLRQDISQAEESRERPVSYTHLDVYKRQVHGEAVRGGFLYGEGGDSGFEYPEGTGDGL